MKVWLVRFGTCKITYYTAHHAAQMARALRLNGTQATVEESTQEWSS